MSSLGKSLRLRRLQGPRGRFVMIPMDHGASNGPIPGLVDVPATVQAVRDGGASCIVVQKGLTADVAPHLGAMGLLIHLSTSTALNPDPNDKRLVGSPQEVARLGADAASVHVNVGAATESRMLEDLGRTAEACDALGLPLLAMMYPRGKDVRDPHDVELVKHVARLGAETGADIVKCPYTGNADTFKEVVRGCPRPVVIAGGPKVNDDRALLAMIHDSIRVGGAGVSLGRNVWQHRNPTAITRAICEIVFNDADLETALKYLAR